MKRRIPVAALVLVSISLGGCGNRYLSPRTTNPFLEDRVRMGGSGQQKMSTLTTRADRRTILVFEPHKVCAEPPPDVAEALYSQSAVNLAKEGLKVAAASTLQTALMQLTRRSQGLDFYRNGAFINCMMYYNNAMGPAQYRAAMSELLTESMKLTKDEIKDLPEIMKTIAEVSRPQPNPASADPPSAETPPAPAATAGSNETPATDPP